MQLIPFLPLLAVGVRSQSIDIGGLLSAEQSVASNVLGQSTLVGAIATAAQSALNSVESLRVSSSSQTIPRTSQRPSSISVDSSTPTSSSSTSPTSETASQSSSAPLSSTLASASSSLLPSSSTFATSLSSSSINLTPAQAATTASPSSSSTAQGNSGNQRKNTLLEIILPTVLSGLTLLVLLAVVVWFCLRRRRRRANRESGMSHLYAAGSTVAHGRHSPAVMEERPESSLLRRASSPAMVPRDQLHDNHDVAYVTPHASGVPAYSIREQPSRPTSIHPSQRGSAPLSRFSNSTSTNRASILAGSQHSGSSTDPRYNRGQRHSYQPIAADERPAELSAEQVSSYSGNGAQIQQLPPMRARTPPLQTMFPWYGPKSEARQHPRRSRGNGLQGTSIEGPGEFDFAFGHNRNDTRTSDFHTEELMPTPESNRFSIRRKPVPM